MRLTKWGFKTNWGGEARCFKASQLHVLKRAQREIVQQHLKSMGVFDPNLGGASIVCRYNGRWYIVDGQHRLVLLKQAYGEDGEVLCVVSKLPPHIAYARHNTKRRAVPETDIFWSYYDSEEEEETHIVEICERHKFHLVRTKKESEQTGNPYCVIAMKKAYQRLGPTKFAALLKLIRQRFSVKEGRCVSIEFTATRALFIKAMREAAEDIGVNPLRERLSKHSKTADQLWAIARQRATGTSSACVTRELRKILMEK